jgi:tetratricopeptide (TPR) repeat protein
VEKPFLKPGAPRATLPDEIRAWARFAAGDVKGASARLEPVADRQTKIGKGEVEVPAREMLADMLLLSGDVASALTEYQKSLASDPNRFNGLFGAGQAAERLGKRKFALSYYQALLANCTCILREAIPALEHAQSFVNATTTS